MENDEREAYGMPRLEYNEKGYQIVDRPSASTKKKKAKSKRKPMGILEKQAFVERMRKAREARANK